jgi:hypothetical protein
MLSPTATNRLTPHMSSGSNVTHMSSGSNVIPGQARPGLAGPPWQLDHHDDILKDAILDELGAL